MRKYVYVLRCAASNKAAEKNCWRSRARGIIDGIPDRVLKNQARVSDLRTRASLIILFEQLFDIIVAMGQET